MIGNQSLRKKSAEVTDFEGAKLLQIIQDLTDTLCYLQENKKIGRAMAAPQIGLTRKIIYYGLPATPFVMVNPKITWRSTDKFWVWDSCFSFDLAFFVEIQRHRKIRVEYQNENREFIVDEFSDDLSELVQHEIDHLNGILATDHLTDVKRIMLRQEWEKHKRGEIRS